MTKLQKYVKPAGAVAALLLLIVMMFQIAIAAGAPFGEISWGGVHDGVLPDNLRIISGVFVFIYAALLFVILRRAGFSVKSPIPDKRLSSALLVFIVWTCFQLTINLATPSPMERFIWAPQLALQLIALLVVYKYGPRFKKES